MGAAVRVPAAVRRKALLAGAGAWLEDLPALVAGIERDWSITVGRPFGDATEAFVAEAVTNTGEPAVLKLHVPRGGDDAANEITVLRIAGGDGCVRLLRFDQARGALLLERLGRSLYELAPPLRRRHEILCSLAGRVWRPAPGCGLPTGAQKAGWLAEYVVTTWEALARPCSERAVEHALTCAASRAAAHDDERAVLVHGDVHQWNALANGCAIQDGFRLVDPDGLLAEPEYDLGIIMREDPVELMRSDPRERARWLATRTGLDAAAIWQWGVVERVSTGLVCTGIGLPAGPQMLAAADRIASDYPCI